VTEAQESLKFRYGDQKCNGTRLSLNFYQEWRSFLRREEI